MSADDQSPTQLLPPTVLAFAQPPVKPTTTAEQDLTTASQRRVNLVWEVTQAIVAVLVVISNCVVGVATGLGLVGPNAGAYPLVLANSLFLIVGFYFSRTNHAAIGGIGPKPAMQSYEGR